MEKFKIEIDRAQIVDTINTGIQEKVRAQMKAQDKDIDEAITQYFKKSLFNNQSSRFESALDYTVEAAFRKGLEMAMEQLNFKEMIAQKAKELLSDNNFIAELAEKKVRASLGLK